MIAHMKDLSIFSSNARQLFFFSPFPVASCCERAVADAVRKRQTRVTELKRYLFKRSVNGDGIGGLNQDQGQNRLGKKETEVRNSN